MGRISISLLGAALVAVTTMAIPASVAAYNPTAAAAYADQWVTSQNPNYPDFGSTDCTNFVSQSLHAGGISMVTSNAGGDRSTLANWFANGNSTGNASFSWSIAPDLMQFLYWQTYGGYARVYAPNQLGAKSGVGIGDVLFYDWGQGEGVSHATIQVAYGTDPKGFTGDLVDEHSNDRKHVFWSLEDYNADLSGTTMITAIYISTSTK